LLAYRTDIDIGRHLEWCLWPSNWSSQRNWFSCL